MAVSTTAIYRYIRNIAASAEDMQDSEIDERKRPGMIS
jgi:hypothetical protein